jgi:hypothetical protein
LRVFVISIRLLKFPDKQGVSHGGAVEAKA